MAGVVFWAVVLLGAVACLVVVVLLLGAVGSVFGRRQQMTRAEVADTIERFLDRTGRPWEWDDFISVPIEDAELDEIRVQCGDLPDRFPVNSGYCGDEGVAWMRQTVQCLRSSRS